MLLKIMILIYMGLNQMVKNKVFVDTGAWIACMSKKDKHHHKAATYII